MFYLTQQEDSLAQHLAPGLGGGGGQSKKSVKTLAWSFHELS